MRFQLWQGLVFGLFLSQSGAAISPACIKQLQAVTKSPGPETIFQAVAFLDEKHAYGARLHGFVADAIQRVRDSAMKDRGKAESVRFMGIAIAGILRAEDLIPDAQVRLNLALDFLLTVQSASDAEGLAAQLRTLDGSEASVEALCQHYREKADSVRAAELRVADEIKAAEGRLVFKERSSKQAAKDLKALSGEADGMRWIDPSFFSLAWKKRPRGFQLPGHVRENRSHLAESAELEDEAVRRLSSEGHYILFTTDRDMHDYLKVGRQDSRSDIVSVTFDANYDPTFHFSECKIGETGDAASMALKQLTGILGAYYAVVGDRYVGTIFLFHPDKGLRTPPRELTLRAAGKDLPVEVRRLKLPQKSDK